MESEKGLNEIRNAEEWFKNSEYGKGRIAGFVTQLMVDYAKHYHKIQPKKNNIHIEWTERYSSTMEADKHGRWAREAYAGNLFGMGLKDKKIARWNIATINKYMADGKDKFVILYHFPSHGQLMIDDLDSARKEVEKLFRWFVDCVTTNFK